MHFKILQNNFYINAFSINVLVNVNWGGRVRQMSTLVNKGGGGGRKSRKSCQRSLRMAPNINKDLRAAQIALRKLFMKFSQIGQFLLHTKNS